MMISSTSMNGLFNGFNTSFNKGLTTAPSTFEKVAMIVPSGTSQESYAWLKDIPEIREWLDNRIINNLEIAGYTVVNRKFELTIAIGREKIEDDQFGVFSVLFEQMGYNTKVHPDKMVYELLSRGAETLCFDGKNFFDQNHPSGDANGATINVANLDNAGNGHWWYLLDTTKPIKPLLYQERQSFEFQMLNDPNSQHAFMHDEFMYGVRGRDNAGYGLWQLAYASNQPLTPDNYEAARAAMTSLRSYSGRPLGITPNVLVVPQSLEGDGRRMVKTDTRVITVTGSGGTNYESLVTNEWKDSADLLVTPFMS